MNHFEVFNKDQLKHSLLAGSYPTCAEARANPFTVELAGTRLRLSFPNGLHEQQATRMVRNFARVPAKAFKPNH